MSAVSQVLMQRTAAEQKLLQRNVTVVNFKWLKKESKLGNFSLYNQKKRFEVYLPGEKTNK